MSSLLAATLLVSLALGTQSEQPSVEGLWPKGVLGELIGNYVTVEGVRSEGGKRGERTLALDTINGKRLNQIVYIWVENLDLPQGKRVILKGYENGGMVGDPPAKAAAFKDLNLDKVKNLAPGSAWNWQWRPYFVVLSVVEPKGLQIQPMTRPN